jgi:hypothetical protein
MSKSRKLPADGPTSSSPLRRVTDQQRPISSAETRDTAFTQLCRKQAQALAAGDPAGDELMAFVDRLYEWPEG